jgi:hypothetical protein
MFAHRASIGIIRPNAAAVRLQSRIQHDGTTGSSVEAQGERRHGPFDAGTGTVKDRTAGSFFDQ